MSRKLWKKKNSGSKGLMKLITENPLILIQSIELSIELWMWLMAINPLLPLTDFALGRAEESRKESHLSGGEWKKEFWQSHSWTMDVIDSLNTALEDQTVDWYYSYLDFDAAFNGASSPQTIWSV